MLFTSNMLLSMHVKESGKNKRFGGFGFYHISLLRLELGYSFEQEKMQHQSSHLLKSRTTALLYMIVEIGQHKKHLHALNL